jgi:hypothetical protein
VGVVGGADQSSYVGRLAMRKIVNSKNDRESRRESFGLSGD